MTFTVLKNLIFTNDYEQNGKAGKQGEECRGDDNSRNGKE